MHSHLNEIIPKITCLLLGIFLDFGRFSCYNIRSHFAQLTLVAFLLKQFWSDVIKRKRRNSADQPPMFVREIG